MASTMNIVALAARTPVGLTAAASAAALRAGISRARSHPYLADAYGEPIKFAGDGLLEPVACGVDRLELLLASCFEELAPSLELVFGVGRTLSIMLSLPEARPGFTPHDGRELARRVAGWPILAGRAVELFLVGAGHAGGLEALQQANQLLQARPEAVCVVAGVDSYFDGYALEWLESRRKLLTIDARGGFAPGEGAAALLLVSDATRRQLRLSSLARVRSIAVARELRDEHSVEGTFGEALTEVMRSVVKPLSLPNEQVADLYCDINDERTRTTELSFALLRIGQVFLADMAYRTPVGSVGDLGAATAPFNCVLAARAWARGYASGPRAMVMASSWGGIRGAALLQEGT
jgi:3-oxoacyl-[acyl-carrier-protein] synthase-1